MKTSTTVVVVVVGAALAYMYLKNRAANTAAYNAYSLGNVGGVAHSPDITTGGVASVLGGLSKLTSWFGGGPTSPSAIQPDANTPYNGNSTIWNPVQSAPAVLPYSYKQQNIDTSSLLGTNDLFTPSNVTGSSGSYADDTPMNFSNVDYGLGY